MNMTEKIEKKLRDHFDIRHIEVINESYMHRGHAGDDGSGESHFKLILSAPDFEGQNRVAAQRMVFRALDEEMRYIHALSIKIVGKIQS